MAFRNIQRHPSYNNRYRRSSSETDVVTKEVTVTGTADVVRDVVKSDSESVVNESAVPDAVAHSIEDKMGTAKSRRARYMESRSTSGTSKLLRNSENAGNDDVFLSLDIGDGDISPVPDDVTKTIEKRHVENTLSNASTKSTMPNPYNVINHRIHGFFWCTCCLYFVFICCLPAMHYMEESDKAFQEGDEKRASRLGKMSSLMFVAGSIISVACYAAILFIIIFFTTFY